MGALRAGCTRPRPSVTMTRATEDATDASAAARSSVPVTASQAFRSSSCAGDAEEQAAPHRSSTLTGPADADGKQPWPAAKQAQLRHHAQAAAGLARSAAKLLPSHQVCALRRRQGCMCARSAWRACGPAGPDDRMALPLTSLDVGRFNPEVTGADCCAATTRV